MSVDDRASRGFSLKRWSERKREAASAAARPVSETPAPPAVAQPQAPASPPAEAAPRDAVETTLPPVETLSIDADFTPFFKPKVEESLKRQALKQLLRDPRFNVMDGLDVYIDDYSQPDPISPELVKELVQARYIFDPPKTRVNEKGEVEDIPPEVPSAGALEPPETLTAQATAPCTPAADAIQRGDPLAPSEPDASS